MHIFTEISPRVLRHQAEHKKLVENAKRVAAVYSCVDSCDLDLRAMEQSSKCGFLSHDLACLRVWTGGLAFTVILVPLRLWHKPLWHRRALELRNYVRKLGHRAIAVPASMVMKQPMLSNARLVASCMGHSMAVTDQITILDRLVEFGGLSLQEASSFVHAKDPAGAVLSMVAKRQVAIDISKPIGPHSKLTALT